MSKETDKQLQFQALSNAVSNNDDATIRTILTNDRTILDLDTSGFSLPMLAVDYNNLRSLQALMEFNPDTTIQDQAYGGQNVLHYAGRVGRTEMIAAILEKDKRALDQVDDRGWSPTMKAVAENQLEAVKEFIKHGANVNIQSIEDGGTALTISTSGGYDAITKALIDAGGRMDITDHYGKDPAYYADQKAKEGTKLELLNRMEEIIQGLKEENLDNEASVAGITSPKEGKAQEPNAQQVQKKHLMNLLNSMINLAKELNEPKSLQEASLNNEASVSVITSPEISQTPPLGEGPIINSVIANIESKEVSASQPPIPPQTQIAEVSSNTPMQPALKSTERG